ncbi:MAG: hypothetical protein V2I35_07120 [Desulfocapsaceae bacterium]|jgi:hypothetical protein|nr:hypothetical protein [Desulfocapsaceae bacterium]
MYSNRELCDRITEMYPEIGACGIDIEVNFDKEKDVWIVDLKKDNHELKHHLELSDAKQCMMGQQCVSLGLEIAQMKKNIEGKQF